MRQPVSRLRCNGIKLSPPANILRPSGIFAARRRSSSFCEGFRAGSTIQTVCTDLYDGFINAVKEELPEATAVADRFYMAKKYRDGADQLRKQEIKRLKKEWPEPEYEQIKGAMWPFRKKPDDLTPEEAARLQRLFTHSPSLHQAYQLRDQLTAIFDQDLTKAEATEKLTQWQQRVSDRGLTCFDSFLTMLENWMDEITNYFLNRDSSGFVEGLNTKIKVLKRRCYSPNQLCRADTICCGVSRRKPERQNCSRPP
jgi:transposase